MTTRQRLRRFRADMDRSGPGWLDHFRRAADETARQTGVPWRLLMVELWGRGGPVRPPLVVAVNGPVLEGAPADAEGGAS